MRVLELRGVRGIGGSLRVSLDPGGGRAPLSLVVSGDNGTGKSSLVDAFQLALQAQVQGHVGNKAASAARSVGNKQLPWVRVTIADGEVIERSVADDRGPDGASPERLRLSPHEPAAGFERTPLVLRRTDILRFWATPAAQRQLVFVRYFQPEPGRSLELPHERVTRLNAERIQAKTRRTEAVRLLAQAARVQSVGSIPQNLADFDRWVDSYFYGGRDSVTHRRKRPVRLPAGTRTALRDARTTVAALASADKALGAAKRQAVERQEGGSELAAVLAEATKDVTRGFTEISPSAPIEAFSLRIGEDSAVGLEIVAQLTNGSEADPAEVLSEANRDLMAFLIFVAVARAAAARAGQAKVLILDDVFQSVDGPIRVAAMDWVLRELPGWQFVLTAHDRLWREQLLTLLARHQVRYVSQEITNWDLSSGPTLRSSEDDPAAGLRRSLGEGSVVGIAMDAGRLLERISDTLSWTFEVSIHRKRGDRYTIGELWPPVRKVLSKTPLADRTQAIDMHLDLRNLLGAHYNEWAQGASLAETRQFGEAVLGLFLAIYCVDCRQWISPAGRNSWRCRCGVVQVQQI